jgi:mannose-1-phosphate guanylyltransferase
LSGDTWALVLAAGDGSRLSSLTTDRQGVSVPKQFCSLDGGASLLGLALERAARVVPRTRITSVVATKHRQWWRGRLSVLPPANIVEQPENRGTAVGVLLPLLFLLERDPGARILFLPSDHFVGDEVVMARVMKRATEAMDHGSHNLYLLGITPDEPDSEFGWIVPGEPDQPSVYRVDRFVEKPPVSIAAELMCRGGMWNSFIMAAAGSTLLSLFTRRMPAVVAALQEAMPTGSHGAGVTTAMAEVYRNLESYDFCRDVLQGEESDLRVLPVPHCGWSDLGTPERVACCLDRRAPATVPYMQVPAGNSGPVLSTNLSQALAAGSSSAAAYPHGKAGRRSAHLLELLEGAHLDLGRRGLRGDIHQLAGLERIRHAVLSLTRRYVLLLDLQQPGQRERTRSVAGQTPGDLVGQRVEHPVDLLAGQLGLGCDGVQQLGLGQRFLSGSCRHALVPPFRGCGISLLQGP